MPLFIGHHAKGAFPAFLPAGEKVVCPAIIWGLGNATPGAIGDNVPIGIAPKGKSNLCLRKTVEAIYGPQSGDQVKLWFSLEVKNSRNRLGHPLPEMSPPELLTFQIEADSRKFFDRTGFLIGSRINTRWDCGPLGLGLQLQLRVTGGCLPLQLLFP